jgi:hypothetical protein
MACLTGIEKFVMLFMSFPTCNVVTLRDNCGTNLITVCELFQFIVYGYFFFLTSFWLETCVCCVGT